MCLDFGRGRGPAPPGGFGADLARCSTAVEEAYPGNLPPYNDLRRTKGKAG
nr:MAG TPA: hypothetical protein [Caudoviricetes sp.]